METKQMKIQTQIKKKKETELIKPRKETRKKAKGTKIPIFKINQILFLSVYDIRNFLDELPSGAGLKYELRKKFQNLERNSPSERWVIEQKEILSRMDKMLKIHINPNKKNNFLKLDQVLKGEFKYLVDLHKIPIDKEILIDLGESVPVIRNKETITTENVKSIPPKKTPAVKKVKKTETSVKKRGNRLAYYNKVTFGKSAQILENFTSMKPQQNKGMNYSISPNKMVTSNMNNQVENINNINKNINQNNYTAINNNNHNCFLFHKKININKTSNNEPTQINNSPNIVLESPPIYQSSIQKSSQVHSDLSFYEVFEQQVKCDYNNESFISFNFDIPPISEDEKIKIPSSNELNKLYDIN
eukprot:TRINITY_DN6844_c0_g1_i1.p1 TRINITY_DN6844_c0_g1~~TRINITY_DN6844_c0_g1_i1.p1  ORF type:complete len:359 (+),score=98.10 TRINITY_DN6844_c0_g1_i1:68-1144(+)